MYPNHWPKSKEEYTKKVLQGKEPFSDIVTYWKIDIIRYVSDNKGWLSKEGLIRVVPGANEWKFIEFKHNPNEEPWYIASVSGAMIDEIENSIKNQEG